MSGKKQDGVAGVPGEVGEDNCTSELSLYHCILYQQPLYDKPSKMEYVKTTKHIYIIIS